MALPNRHFKIDFSGHEVEEELEYGYEYRYEYSDIVGLFNFLVRGMQFSWDYDVEESDGQQLPNGTWTGIFGRLNRSEVDFVPASLIMTEEEWDAAAYNYPYANDELTFVTRKPEYSPETMALFRTLSPNVWLSLLACIILVTLACFVAMKQRCTLGDILLHVLAIALNQEGNLVPRRVGEVLLLSTWLGAMAVFTFCFKSVLLSFLTFPPLSGVRTVPELATAIRAGQYSAFSAYPVKTFPNYLQRSPNDDLRVIGENMLINNIGDLDDFFDDEFPKYPVMALVIRRSHVAFADGLLYVSKDNMGSLNFATAVRKDFCCKDEMDMLVHRFVAAGISQKINRFTNYVYTNFLVDDGENSNRKITVMDILGALIILVAGHCLSVCVLIVECYMKHSERLHPSTRTASSGGV